jgi:hypothetical protein
VPASYGQVAELNYITEGENTVGTELGINDFVRGSQRTTGNSMKGDGGMSMSVQENVQIVKNGLEAFGRGDIKALLALLAEDGEWISPGEGLPLAGTHRGHAALADLFQKFSEAMEISTLKPHEFVLRQ